MSTVKVKRVQILMSSFNWACLMPQLKRASARRREEKNCSGVYMIQQVAAERLGWGQASSLD